MSVLMDRIRSVGQHQRAATPIKDYMAPKEIPLVRIQIRPGTAVYDEPDWIITADGDVIPATSAGTWGQLYAAGRA